MEQALIDSDPYNTGSDLKYLVGAKLGQGVRENIGCIPPAAGDVYVDQRDLRFTDGVKDSSMWKNYRDISFKLCTYRSAKPDRAIVSAGATNTNPSSKYLIKTPWNQSANPNTIIQCQGGNSVGYVYASEGTSAPKDMKYFHQLFVAQNSCPAWAPQQDSGDLNYTCKGGIRSVLCGQRASDVLACCMGKKSTCRKDQTRQSTFCDNFMLDYCTNHKDAAECKCINGPGELSAKIGAPPVCWSKDCADRNKVYTTKSMNELKCPPINVCDNDLDIGELQALGNANVITLSSTCGAGAIGGEEGITTTDLGATGLTAAIAQSVSFVATHSIEFGIGSFVFLLVLLLLALVA